MNIEDLVAAVRGHCAFHTSKSSCCRFVDEELSDEEIRQVLEEAFREVPLDPEDSKKDAETVAIEILLDYAEGALEYMDYLADPDYD